MPSAGTVLIVTYTMASPEVVGVFFRALRLGFELHRRGHRVVISNCGPMPEDPKVERARERLEIHSMAWESPDFGVREARAQLTSYEPDLIVFGEGPFDTMKMAFRAACGVGVPFVLLDQYYQDWLVKEQPDVDRFLLYGLAPFVGEGEFDFGERCRLVPPFVGRVVERSQLPAPAAIDERPWVTLLGFDVGVLEAGLDLMADLPEPASVVVALSHRPEETRARMLERGLGAERALSLGLQPDDVLFGFIAASRAVILANGYMQIIEAVALGCPALCISRGVGLEGWTLDDRFRPYVSIEEEPEGQRRRLAGWLAESPFPDELARELASQRDGARVCAEAIEELLSRPVDEELAARRRRRYVEAADAATTGGKEIASESLR